MLNSFRFYVIDIITHENKIIKIYLLNVSNYLGALFLRPIFFHVARSKLDDILTSVSISAKQLEHTYLSDFCKFTTQY